MTPTKTLSASALAQLRAAASATFDYCILCLRVLDECARRNEHETVSLRSTIATIDAAEFTPGSMRIARERIRQVSVERYDAAHDDEHSRGELAAAAVAYITPLPAYYRRDTPDRGVVFSDPWPFAARHDRRHKLYVDGVIPSSTLLDDINVRIELLEKGGAFAAAEIDRLLRVVEKR